MNHALAKFILYFFSLLTQKNLSMDGFRKQDVIYYAIKATERGTKALGPNAHNSQFIHIFWRQLLLRVAKQICYKYYTDTPFFLTYNPKLQQC